MSIQALREQRSKLAKQLRDLVENHEGEWGGDDQTKYDKMVKDVDDLDGKIERAQAVIDREASTDQRIDNDANSRGISTDEATQNAIRHSDITARWLRGGDNALNVDDFQFLNALSTTTDSEGGHTVAQNLQSRLLDAMKLFGGMREAASTMSVGKGSPIQWPTTDSSSEEGEIVGQNDSRTDDNSIDFGVIGLDFHVYSSKVVAVPRELLQDSEIDLEGHILERLANRIWRIQNRIFTTGTGTNESRGLLQDSVLGVTAPTGQVDDIEFEDLLRLMHSVDPVYRTAASFMMHDTTLSTLKQKKDGDGRPLWLPGVASSEPDTIYNTPYSINQSMPVLGAGNKAVAYGDMKKYQILDAVNMEMFRFTDSAYTKRNQVGFLGMMRSSGRLVDVGGAIKHFQNAAS